MAQDVERNGCFADDAEGHYGSDYEKAYFELVREITQTLGPYLGAIKGPHPTICSICKGGPCDRAAFCEAEYLWIDTPEDLLDLAAKDLYRLHGLPQ